MLILPKVVKSAFYIKCYIDKAKGLSWGLSLFTYSTKYHKIPLLCRHNVIVLCAITTLFIALVVPKCAGVQPNGCCWLQNYCYVQSQLCNIHNMHVETQPTKYILRSRNKHTTNKRQPISIKLLLVQFFFIRIVFLSFEKS